MPGSEPAGSTGVSIETVPILEAAGHPIGGGWTPAGSVVRLRSPIALPLPNCASVQNFSLFAAAGFRPMPFGRLTSARLTFDWPIAAEAWNGTVAVTVGPVGESVWLVPGVTEMPGLKGTSPQPVGWILRADRDDRRRVVVEEAPRDSRASRP